MNPKSKIQNPKSKIQKNNRQLPEFVNGLFPFLRLEARFWVFCF